MLGSSPRSNWRSASAAISLRERWVFLRCASRAIGPSLLPIQPAPHVDVFGAEEDLRAGLEVEAQWAAHLAGAGAGHHGRFEVGCVAVDGAALGGGIRAG